MINGVLVERTVKDVVPALKTNSEGLRKVLEDLVKQYNGKQAEMEKWKVRLDLAISRVYQENRSADLHSLRRRRTISRWYSNEGSRDCNGLGSTGVTSGRRGASKI